MLAVGLTGGIGAGKSAVAARLVHRGAVLIDSDRLAREVVAPGSDGLAAVVATFGSGVLTPAGHLDRPALGAIVFADPQARGRLEGIVHPRVRARSAELAAAAPADAVVVHDVPLLVEVGLAPTYHLVAVVEADPARRVERLVRDRGMTAEQAGARIAAQADDGRRRAAADVLLRNDGTLVELRAAVDRLWDDRLVPYERNLRAGRPVMASPASAGGPGGDGSYGPGRDWAAEAARVVARIRHRLGDVPVAHVGPTAVPGLPAPDVIDLQLGVTSQARADEWASVLAGAGLPRWPDDRPRVAAAERLHGSADPGRPVRLHLRRTDSPAWRRALLVRDHLRADPAAREAAARRPGAVYPWTDDQEAAARRWAAATGWRPPRD